MAIDMSEVERDPELQRVCLGVYGDRQGQLHIRLKEILSRLDIPISRANIETLMFAIRQISKTLRITITIVDVPDGN